MLSKDDIIKADDLETITISIPEWGGEAFLTPMKGFERDAFEMSVSDGGMSNFRARLVALCLVDDKGTRLFNDSEVGELGNKNASVLNRVFDEVRTLCGMTEDDVKELEGNSESATSDGSGSS